MDQFRQGLRNDVKDLLLTFHEDPKSLMEAISRVVRCDNRLFERRFERQQMLRRQPEQSYASVVATPPQISRPITRDDPTPMEIESTQRRVGRYRMRRSNDVEHIASACILAVQDI